MCTKYWLILPKKCVVTDSLVRLTDRLDMTIVADWDTKVVHLGFYPFNAHISI